MEDYIILKVVIENIINSMSDTEKSIANLKFFEGYKNKEIANEMNVSVSCVGYHINKIRKRIKDELYKS